MVYTAICRCKPRQATYWINALRELIISMKCIRSGLPSDHAKGADRISVQEIKLLESTFIKSLEVSELLPTLAAISQLFILEVRHHHEELAIKLAFTFQKLVI